VHRTIELSLGEPAPGLTAAWKQACDELADEGIDPLTAPNARRSLLRLERRLPDLLAYIEEREPATRLREQELTSTDGSVTGLADLVLLGGRPSIVDHKTGIVLADGLPRSQYERQLSLYAWLVDESLGVDVVDGALFSLRDGVVPVDVSGKVREPIVAAALRARDEYNARAPGEQPATPSETACGGCPFVGPCDRAWDALRAGAIEHLGWGEAARGPLRAPIVVAAGEVSAVPIAVGDGTVGGDAVIIDVPSALVTGCSVGDVLSAWHLAKRSDEPLTLAWREGASALHVEGSRFENC
jgi:hypothetical protein